MLDIPKVVKDLFKTNGVLKNIRITFPNGERADICNDQLVKESLKFDESISSRQEIKFGLCESSQLSFECVDVGNIKGMEIDACIEIDATGVEAEVAHSAEHEPVVILAVPQGETEGKIFIICDFPELAVDEVYLSQDGTDISWKGSDASGTQPLYVHTNDPDHCMKLSYYRDVTGVDPRGTQNDIYDGYHGGGYRRTYLYSMTTQKFYPVHVTDFEWEEDNIHLIATLNAGFENEAFLKALKGIYFDSAKEEYVYPFEAQVAPDVPFPFYRVPLGHFIVDEAKRDASMRMRKVTAYSSLGKLTMPTYIVEKGYNSYIGNFNVANYLLLCNSKIFDENRLIIRKPIWSTSPTTGYTYIEPWDDGTYTYTIQINGQDYNGEGLLSTNPDMQYLLRCNTFCISDAEREQIEADLETFIENWKNASNVGNAPDDIFIHVRNIIKNAIRPLPYTFDGIPKDYRLNVNVGDIYATNGHYMFIESISISVKAGDTEKLSFSWTNPDADNSDYDIIDTSYYPQYLMSLKGELTDAQYGYSYILQLLNIAPRNLLESYVELQGCLGRIGRNGIMDFLRIAQINFEGLYPNHDLLPSGSLYPQAVNDRTYDISGLAVVEDECMISSWYEEYYIKFGKIICTYYSRDILDENNYPTEQEYEYEWDSDKGALTYDLRENEILKNSFYPSNMGGYTEAEMKEIIKPLVDALKGLKFYPSDFSCIGLPYIEAGDWALTSMYGNKVLNLCLSRTLDGIQAMRDKMKSD